MTSPLFFQVAQGVRLLLRIFYIAREVHAAASLPMNEIYDESVWFNPRGRESREDRFFHGSTACMGKLFV